MIVCFDIGGSAIKAAIVFAADDIRPLPRVETPAHDFERFCAVIGDIVQAAGGTPSGIALSICGVADPDSQAIKCANIPCIDGRQLGSELSQRLGLPVVIANDADCFALAEAGLGAGRGHAIVFGAILGTGVGGGLVANGRLVNAAGGFAGEWGHGPAVAAQGGHPPAAIPAFACGCGQTGCVDTIGGARGLERLHGVLHGVQETSEAILADWQAGETRAGRTVDVYADLVAAPLALTVNITGATIVPVGGGLSNCEPLLALLDARVRAQILRQFQRPLVVRAECRIEPGLIGAALLGLGDSV